MTTPRDEATDEVTAVGGNRRAVLISFIVGLAAVVVVGIVARDVDPPPDPASAGYAAETLAALGGDADDVVEQLLITALGDGIPQDEAAALVATLGTTLRGASSTGFGDADVIANAIVRRLDLDGADIGSIDDLMALAIAEIDPSGSISTGAELLRAFEEWAAANPGNVLRIVAGADTGPLVNLTAADFATVVAALEDLTLAADIVDVPLGGVADLETIAVPGVSWVVDRATRSVTFTGRAEVFGGKNDVLFAAVWGDDTVPSLLAGIETRDWSLGDLGVPGSLGSFRFPAIGFALSGDDSVAAGSLPPEAAGFFARSYGTPVDGVTFSPGINLLGSLPFSALPAIATNRLGVSDPGGGLPVSGPIGSSFGLMRGDGSAEGLDLQVPLPGLGAPALPDWLTAADASPWSLALGLRDRQLEFGIAGPVEADIDDRTLRFAAEIALSADSSTAAAVLHGELVEPWAEPFGVAWLTFDNAAMTVDLGNQAASADFVVDLDVAGRSASLGFAVGRSQAQTDLTMTATLESITAGEVVTFIAETLSADAPPEIPALSLRDVALTIETGATPTTSFAATASVEGFDVDVLATAMRPSSGSTKVIFGVGFESWGMADLLPDVAGTPLEALEFPRTALVLSTYQGRLRPASMPRPLTEFLERAVPAESMELQPGLSMLGSLDFAGTALERPMEALGFSGASFPITGTLPGKMLGLSGSSTGGAGLGALSLRVSLPDIRPPGSPEWFVSGRVSLVVSGEPSIGLEGSMTVAIDEDVLTFVVGAQFVRRGAGVTISIFGILEADEPWVAPLGVEWLTLERAALELTITPIGSIGVGFAGTMELGTKDVEAALALEISAATGVPTNLILRGASNAGISTNDLLLLQRSIAGAAGAKPLIDASEYPSLTLRDAEFQFAPKSSDVLGVQAGFIIAGDAYAAVGGGAQQRFAFLDVRIGVDGLRAAGNLRAYELGPLDWNDIDLDLELSPTDQHFIFDGGVELLGIDSRVSVDLSTRSVFFAGRQALRDLTRIVDLFEEIAADPAAGVQKLSDLFELSGAKKPPWVDELLVAVDALTEKGSSVSSELVDTVLEGGEITLPAFPVGGLPTECVLPTPIEASGRCWTTPPIPATQGIPRGGDAKACGFQVTLPVFGEVGLTKELDGRCYFLLPDPCSPFEIVCDPDGTPDGGMAKRCELENPIESDGRCYVIPPLPAVPGLPLGGADQGCPVPTTQENGRCWVVTPSGAAVAIRFPGLCLEYPIPCDVETLIRQDVARIIADKLKVRFGDW